MFRRTDMNPIRKGIISRPWKVSSTWFKTVPIMPKLNVWTKGRKNKCSVFWKSYSCLVCGKTMRNNSRNSHTVGIDKIMVSWKERDKLRSEHRNRLLIWFTDNCGSILFHRGNVCSWSVMDLRVMEIFMIRSKWVFRFSWNASLVTQMPRA